MVHGKGDWDYKQKSHLYEDFGNFNYGATGTAFGFSQDVLLREAGAASLAADPNRKEEGLGEPGQILNPLSEGTPPYGDDPLDQIQIKNGINYCHYAMGRK